MLNCLFFEELTNFILGWASGGSGFWRGGWCGVMGGEDTLVTAKRKSFERFFPVMFYA